MRLHDGLMSAAAAPLVLVLMALATTPAAGAISVLVEAESYVGAYDMGGASIMSILCSSASGEHAVDGLDIAGEWIELKATIADEACYDLLIGYQAPYEETIETLVTVFDEGHAGVEGDSEFALVGAGLG